MAAPEEYTDPLYPDLSVTIALFNDVKNASQLKQMAVSGDIQATLLKSSMILNSWQVLMAANQAIHLHKTDAKKTRQLHSEVIYSLASSRNISDSFKRFGISDEETSILVVAIHPSGQSVLDILDKVDGTMIDLSQLETACDTQAIMKVYKIKSEELSTGNLMDTIVNRIASKSFISY